MIRKIVTCFIFLLSISMSFGQSSELILTASQNEKWFDSLATLSLSSQLQMIKQRLLADTNVFVRKGYPDGIKVKDSLGSRFYGVGRPLLIVENIYFQIENNIDRKKIIQLAELINSKYIGTITPLKGSDRVTTALYGSSAMSGVILIKLKRKSDARLFKKLKIY